MTGASAGGGVGAEGVGSDREGRVAFRDGETTTGVWRAEELLPVRLVGGERVGGGGDVGGGAAVAAGVILGLRGGLTGGVATGVGLGVGLGVAAGVGDGV